MYQVLIWYISHDYFLLKVIWRRKVTKLSLLIDNLLSSRTIYCIEGNVNVCLIFPNLPNGFETGTIKTLSLIIFVDMVGQTMHVFRLSRKAVYISYSLSQQMAPYVF